MGRPLRGGLRERRETGGSSSALLRAPRRWNTTCRKSERSTVRLYQDGRVVKALDLRSNGQCPRGFEPHSWLLQSGTIPQSVLVSKILTLLKMTSHTFCRMSFCQFGFVSYFFEIRFSLCFFSRTFAERILCSHCILSCKVILMCPFTMILIHLIKLLCQASPL